MGWDKEKRRAAEVRYREAHRSELAARARARYAASPDKDRIRARARIRSAAYYKANRDEINAGLKADRAANPEKQRARSAASYARHRAARSAAVAAWQHANPERVLASKAKWRRDNAERVLAWTHIRRARLAGAEYELVDVQDLYLRDQGVCQICKKPVNAKAKGQRGKSTDHIVPITKGGSHTWANVQLAHLNCNERKNAGDKIAAQMRLFG